MFLSNKEIENLTVVEKNEYFNSIKEMCLGMKRKCGKQIIREMIIRIIPYLRGYDFEVRGIENIPKESNAIFLCNHSNAHDFFTMQEAFRKAGCNITFLASNEDISDMIKAIFISCGGVLIDRKNKVSIEKGIINFSANILSGMSGVIYGEATWNLHPYKPMQPIKVGTVNIAAITETPIIPTVFEYVEVPQVCSKEKDIYSKCVVQFASPVNISRDESLFAQTDILQSAMEQNRRNLWKELGIVKNSLTDVNQEIYLNHTYLKKFGMRGYNYDTYSEMRFLLSKDGKVIENEYYLDDDENFVPRVIKNGED